MASTVAGTATGAAVGAAGSLFDLRARAAVGTAAGLLVALLPLLKVPLPQRDRETPQLLLHHGPLLWSLSNGALLGTALTSRIGFWLWYLVPAGCLLSGSPAVGGLLWGAYALCRLAVIDVVAFQMLRHGCRIHDLTDRLLSGRAQVQRVMTALAVVVGTVFALVVGG